MKYIIALIIAFFSLNASAGNDYCDSRPASIQRDCYQQIIDGHYRVIKKFADELNASPKVPAKTKEELNAFYGNWMNKIGRECRSQVCEYDSTKNLAMHLRIKMYDLGIAKPR